MSDEWVDSASARAYIRRHAPYLSSLGSKTSGMPLYNAAKEEWNGIKCIGSWGMSYEYSIESIKRANAKVGYESCKFFKEKLLNQAVEKEQEMEEYKKFLELED